MKKSRSSRPLTSAWMPSTNRRACRPTRASRCKAVRYSRNVSYVAGPFCKNLFRSDSCRSRTSPPSRSRRCAPRRMFLTGSKRSEGPASRESRKPKSSSCRRLRYPGRPDPSCRAMLSPKENHPRKHTNRKTGRDAFIDNLRRWRERSSARESAHPTESGGTPSFPATIDDPAGRWRNDAQPLPCYIREKAAERLRRLRRLSERSRAP